MRTRRPHRYQLPGSEVSGDDRAATAAPGPTLRRRTCGSPTALAVAALRELNPTGPARAALLEALDADGPAALDRLLRTRTLEPALRQLVAHARDILTR